MGKFVLLLVLLINLSWTVSKQMKPGLSGRYCAQGSYNINTGVADHYNYDHYCGVHINFPSCVSVSNLNNGTVMGCDNDPNVPSCSRHDESYCYYDSANNYVCCCNYDHCNDCTINPLNCVNPYALLPTTTTTTTTPAPTTPRICPAGSLKWMSLCLRFEKNSSAFIIAEDNCVNFGGHLVSIHDGFTNNFIAQNAGLYFNSNSETEYWIGGSDMYTLKNWTWTDGTPFVFNEWNHQKNATGEDCIGQSLADGRWNADNCFNKKPYVCSV
uniref:C-type lectin domain-containing protein n=1 Tax=Panagrolaimus sp. JU765 TaxID=591449 RepID=A0AC34QUA1_9BILA